MERSYPSFPFEREPRSAGFPPSRMDRNSDPSPMLPGQHPRYSDPGPTVSGHHPRMEYHRHYSAASTASTVSSSSSLFGSSYSISSASSRGEDGYLSPPASRRTSEATKLPSIHELEKNLPPVPIDLPSSGSSPPKRDSLATISEENSMHPDHLAFPPKYPGSTISAIPKSRSNSYPPSTPGSFPPPPAFTQSDSPSQQYHPDPRSTPISRAIGLNHQVMRFMRDYEIIEEHSKHIYHFARQFKEMLTRDLAQGAEHLDLPSSEVVTEHLNRLDQITLRLRDIGAYRSSVAPYSYVKHEDDGRMHDVVPTSTRHYDGYGPGMQGGYQDLSPTEQYWPTQSETGRSKYKKRSRAAPPGRCHSCNIESTPEWRRGPDGARTLCNACDYAKVSKRNQREQQSSPRNNTEITNGPNQPQDNRQ